MVASSFRGPLLGLIVFMGLGAAASAAPREAQPQFSPAGRPLTPSMSCEGAQQLVTARKEVVMATGRDLYDRFVFNEGLCGTNLMGVPAFVPTRTSPQCFIGYTCVPRINEGF